MAGKYHTEAQKRGIKKYFDKLKEQGIWRDHGINEQSNRRHYIANAYKWLPKIFAEQN